MASGRLQAGRKDWVDYRVPRGSRGVELLRAHFTGPAYERHSHESYAIGVTEAGVQAFTCRGAARASQAGMVVAINPDEPHDGHAVADEGFTYRMIYLPPELMRRILEEAREGRTTSLPFARSPVIADPALGRSIAALHRALETEAPRLEREALLDHTVLRFAARHGETRVAPDAAHPGGSALERVRDYLRDTPLAEDIGGDAIARLSGMSRFHLWRAFRRRYGLPPHAYRLQLRLAAARRLLASGRPPAEVAAALGFADQSHLHKRFKGAFGVTPGQFVASQLSNAAPREVPAK